MSRRIEFSHPVSFRVVDPIAEDGGLTVGFRILDGVGKHRGESCAVEDIIAEDKADGIIADEIAAYEEGLSQSVGGGLLGVAESHAVI